MPLKYVACHPPRATAIKQYWGSTGDLSQLSPPNKYLGCAIITTGANNLVKFISKRLPVVLPRAKGALWLEAAAAPKTLQSVLKLHPDNLMKGYEISTLINSPRNDRVEVLKPIEEGI
ncbi:MAG: hypothetical protein GX349_02870 [Firmicutes bacterium]|nr:hypothetical protein [Bacillota bacterium]